MSGERPTAADPLAGKVISERYRLLRKLGEGGMGSVYLAEHVLIEKKLALKLLAPELTSRTDLAARFLQEAKSASRIGHENVIDISDFGQSPDGFVYIAMEYLDGVDLGEMVRRDGPLPWPRARGIVLQIGKALRAAHAQGIVHRDMKPENIFLIQREGRPDFVKLLDFGIARIMGLAESTPRLTQTGMIFGTPEYMSPEQAEGKDADHRADLYAMGCMIYHLVTGTPPFQAETFVTMLSKHLLEDAVPPSVRRPDLALSPALDALVMRALEKDRGERWQSVDQLMEAVVACADAPAEPARGSATRAIGGGAPARSAPRPRISDSELLAADDVGDRPPVASSSRRIALLAAGALLGTGAALWWALSGHQGNKPAVTTATTVSAPAPPAAVAPPVPAPPPPTPAAAATPPAPVPTPPPPAAVTKRHPIHRPERPSLRPPAEEPPPSVTPPKPSRTPPGLKPFPQ